MKPGSHSFTFRQTRFDVQPLPAGLYLVSTPIGNLGDITIRALETLAGSTVIACEDTRTSGVLLTRYGIDRPKTSYTEHNAPTKGADLLRQIDQGAAISLISDAGTPLVSDPGSRLVLDVIAAGFPVVPIPGASAPLAALVASGLSGTDFRFLGFPPNKPAARERWLMELSESQSTLIFFESPSRAVATLVAMTKVFGDHRQAVVARELTKMHETFARGTLSALAEQFQSTERVRGEFVILVAGAEHRDMETADVTALLRNALSRMKTRDAAAEVAQLTGQSRQQLYKMALEMKQDE